MGFADAVAREAAWLQASGDGLPALLETAGGPFGIVQGYWPGARFATKKPGAYLMRGRIAAYHLNALRYQPQYVFRIRVIWPIRAVTLIAETEQQNLDNAIQDVVLRVIGPLEDKTHGGRFLSVAEAPREQPVTVEYDDPEQTIAYTNDLRASVSYYADDLEFAG